MTPPKAVDQSQRSQPWTSRDRISAWGPVLGAPIYRTGIKYMRIIYAQVLIWNVWPLGTTDDWYLLNIWKYIDVICFTGEVFVNTVRSPLSCLHECCQGIIGLGNGLASVRCQASTWTNAELLPMVCRIIANGTPEKKGKRQLV